MPEITQVELPGVGVRHEFTTSGGERVAVIAHRTGRQEIFVYDSDDPDRCTAVLELDGADSQVLAELLGVPSVSEVVAEVRQNVAGLALDWLTVAPESQVAGRTIGEQQLRSRTGASIVAIVRGATTVPAPEPDVVLEGGDVLVAVGTADGLTKLRTLLQT